MNIPILFKQSGAIIKTQTCTITEGQSSAKYTAQYLPEGSYEVVVQIPDGYKLTSEVQAVISAKKDETKNIDIKLGKLATYTVKTTDFTEPWTTALETASADGFSMDKYTVTGSETANLGEVGNAVYKFTKASDVTIPSNVGGYWDILSAVKAEGNTLENADMLQFSYDFLMETTDYLPANYSYFDLATSTVNAGENKADTTRFIR